MSFVRVTCKPGSVLYQIVLISFKRDMYHFEPCCEKTQHLITKILSASYICLLFSLDVNKK